MKIREFFPNMPEEVFEMWLAPFVEEKGWPFVSPNDDLFSSDWRFRLGLSFTLSDWYQAEWELKNIPKQKSQLTGLSVSMIESIIGDHKYGRPSLTSGIKETKLRFEQCLSFVQVNGTIPRPVVLRKLSEGYELLDGNHRLAALFYLNNNEPSEFPAWVVRAKQT